MKKDQKKDFLGVGIRFPLKIENGKLAWSEYEESIQESIRIILETIPGERVMRPDFGCNLYQLVFAPNTEETAFQAEMFIKEALKKWEKRIENISIAAAPNRNVEHRLDIDIQYNIISSNSSENLVYPFYLESLNDG